MLFLHVLHLKFQPENIGGGKTTLLKAIAGLIPHSVDLAGNPMKDKPHISGKIEYNGVTKEVSSFRASYLYPIWGNAIT